WGIFLIEFKHRDAFTTGRGMTGPLRRILRGLVPSKRKQSHLASFKREHLLFICTHEFQPYRFAYFKAPPKGTAAAPLAAFGWGPGDPIRTCQIARIKRGIEAYQYTIAPTASSCSWQPYFQGAVDRYIVRPADEAAFVKPKESDADWHRGPRLVIRRLVSRANRLMAARMRFDAVVKKDLYVLRLDIDADEDDLLFLLGIVNSSLASYLYLCRSAAAQKDDFRQVSLAGLRDLPVPNDFARKADLVAKVRNMEALRLGDEERRTVDAEIDRLVFDAFGINQEGRSEVAAFLGIRG
ncbi:MAG TPA: TaqI-like C-terminal specificity domain-containing protein, partial [Pirellulales bacterium]|nr:TaqI-like C-terminal specificity domain-containing protein [Pirellulales bacterium]